MTPKSGPFDLLAQAAVIAAQGIGLFIVGVIALAYLPTLELTFDYDGRDVFVATVFLAITIIFFSLVWKICRVLLGDGLASPMVFISCLLGITMLAGAFPIVGLVVLMTVPFSGYFLLRSRAGDSVSSDRLALALLFLFAVCALLLFPSYLTHQDLYENTGGFFIQAMLPLKKFSDTLYHHTLISSILSAGVASTGLNGVVADPYYVGGHYFVAGVMRLLHLPIETAPGVLYRATGSALALASVMLGVYGIRLMGQRHAAGPKAPVLSATAAALLAGLMWLLAERACSALFPAATNHLAVISNAAALPSAGLLAIFAMLLAVAPPGMRKELLGYRYVFAGLTVLFFACISKISNGLLLYCIGSAAYAVTFLFTADRRDAVVKGIIWIGGGAILLYASYLYVAEIGSSGEMFDLETARRLFDETRGWRWNTFFMSMVSLGLWIAYSIALKTASISSLVRLAAVHVAGPLACIIVNVSAVVERRPDMAYFWISAIQIEYFSAVVAATLLAAMMLERVLAKNVAERVIRSSLIRPVAWVAALIAIGFGLWSVYGAVNAQKQLATRQLCDLIGKSRCRGLHGASPNELIRSISSVSPVARIAYLVRSRGLAFNPDVLLVIDKRTGFFKSEGKRTLKMNKCYHQGWILYMVTGTPLAWGIPKGLEKDGLCQTPTASQEDMWRRYGFGAYQDGSGTAREHSVETLREACLQEAYRDKRFFYIDKDLKGTIVDCKATVSAAS